MTEREDGIEIMMRLLGQSLKLVRAFIEPSTILIHVRMFFSSTRKPNIFVLKPDAHVKKVQIQFYRPSKNIPLVTQPLYKSFLSLTICYGYVRNLHQPIAGSNQPQLWSKLLQVQVFHWTNFCSFILPSL